MQTWTGKFFNLKLFRMVLFALLALTSTPTAADKKNILIIQSSENTFFTITIQKLMSEALAGTEFQVASLKTITEDDSALQQATYVVTLGLDAADYTHQAAPQKTVLHSYITEFQSQKHALSPHHHLVLLDQPPQRYLKFIQLLLASKNIGIIKNKSTALKPEKIQALNSTLGIQLEQRLFEKGDNPVNTVRNLLHTNDVLLILPEPDVYNRNTLKGILLTSYRQQKPVISYSPSQVKSGALAAIFASPEQIGRQLAGLLNKILLDEELKLDSVYFASEFDISFNPNVAKSLGLILPDREDLLRKLRQDQTR